MDPGEKKKRATYQDVEEAPETVVAEIIDGELVASPRPHGQATSVGSVLAGELHAPFNRGRGGPGGWIILFEPELHLDDGDVLVPDLGGWRRDRLAVIPEGHFEVAPDWICEVLSPSTEKRDPATKLERLLPLCDRA